MVRGSGQEPIWTSREFLSPLPHEQALDLEPDPARNQKREISGKQDRSGSGRSAPPSRFSRVSRRTFFSLTAFSRFFSSTPAAVFSYPSVALTPFLTCYNPTRFDGLFPSPFIGGNPGRKSRFHFPKLSICFSKITTLPHLLRRCVLPTQAKVGVFW